MLTIISLHVFLVCLRLSSTVAKHKATPKPPDNKAALDKKFGKNLVTGLRTDANLDLSADEEYDDLRAELLAYQTVLNRMKEPESGRKSMMTTECWKLGGICVNYRLCDGYRSLTEVPGCKDKLNVCCFAWNKYHVKDMRDFGIRGPYPWSSLQKEWGPLEQDPTPRNKQVTKRLKKKKKLMLSNSFEESKGKKNLMPPDSFEKLREKKKLFDKYKLNYYPRELSMEDTSWEIIKKNRGGDKLEEKEEADVNLEE